MLVIKGLKKSFGDKDVLRGLDLTGPAGSIFGFIGKNGAGKTTTMKAILGLMKADGGSITVDGEDVVYVQTLTNKYIGYLPDVPEFYGFMTAREYLAFSAGISEMNCDNLSARIEELLTLVGLGEEKHRIKGYSRGMKQRLGIAQALLSEPLLLICDEPTSALDPVGRKEILDILLSLKGKTTVLFSTHILADVERICTDVAFLDGGVITLQGSPAEIKKKYRSDEYCIETECASHMELIAKQFPNVKISGETEATFSLADTELFAVMEFAASNRIPLPKLQRLEPSLESLFLEVKEK